MANVKSRLKSHKCAPKKGRGKVKKSSARVNVPQKPDKTVTKKRCLTVKDKTTTDETNDSNAPTNKTTTPKKISVDIDDVIVNLGSIITRSGLIIKKSKDDLKAMDDILKSELLIVDKVKKVKAKINKESSVSKGVNNNNDVQISDQNKTEKNQTKELENGIDDVPKSVNNKNDCNTSSDKAVSPDNKKENLKNKSSNKVKIKKPSKINGKLDNRIYAKENQKNKTKSDMEEGVREDVINKMKSILSPDDDVITENDLKSRKYVRTRPKPAKNTKTNLEKDCGNKTKKRKIDSVEKSDAKSAKTKQVTLSNGVVLTLALIKCDYCQKSFSNKSSLGRHMLSHVDLRPHHCLHCPRKFRYQSTLRVHMQRRHPGISDEPEYYTCHICDKAFLMEENLELHLASHVKTENNYTCLYCDKKFSYRLLLLQHEKTHLVTGRFKCYLCELSYDCRSRLSHHIKTHTKIKDYICQYCGKEFLRLNSIKRHVQVCHGGHRIQCPICFKKLKGHLTEHMRLHEQKRPHVCPDCGQRFTQSTQLTVHRRSHSGQRPYTCRICNQPFGHSNALMLHIRRHTGEKPFDCAMCPMAFSQLPHMKSHMRRIHGKENAYKCPKCDEFFKLKSHLDTHSKKCKVGERELSFEEKIEASVRVEEVEIESVMSLSKMRFLLALLLTMIASKEKLKYLGFNKRLIDDLLEESLEAMGHIPCKDETMSPLKRLKTNLEILLEGTIPAKQMIKFKNENKTTEELLVLLTDEKKKD